MIWSWKQAVSKIIQKSEFWANVLFDTFIEGDDERFVDFRVLGLGGGGGGGGPGERVGRRFLTSFSLAFFSGALFSSSSFFSSEWSFSESTPSFSFKT